MSTITIAVSERIREIGIIKAIEATNRFVLRLFLLELIILGFIGGIVGILVGMVLSYAIARMLSQVSVQRVLTPLEEGILCYIG